MEEDFSKYPNKRKTALDTGAKAYFTGKPCKHGHVDLRNAVDGQCRECSRISKRKWDKDNEAHVKEYRKKNYSENAEDRRKYSKTHYLENREYKIEYSRKYREENPEYYKNYYIENREQILERKRDWRQNNPENVLEYSRKWRENNPLYFKEYYENNKQCILERCRDYYINNRNWILEKNRKYNKWYSRNNPDKVNARTAAYRAAKIQRTLKFSDGTLEELNKFLIESTYKEAQELKNATGVPHDVDHIIPLNGKDVSGLHVWYNLRAIPSIENQSKNNTLEKEFVTFIYKGNSRA